MDFVKSIFHSGGGGGEDEEEDVGPRRFLYNAEMGKDATTHEDFADNSIKTSRYNIVTFVPQNLMEQFMRLANSYFLAIAMLQLVPGLSSINPYTSLLPLMFVLGVSMFKEGKEDLSRHREDDRVNSSLVDVYNSESKKWEQQAWCDVKVGSILRILDKQPVPCDVIVLATSDAGNICYINSANLDGETNLKIHTAHAEFGKVIRKDSEENLLQDLDKLTGSVIECEHPNNNLYKFQGNFQPKGNTANSSAAFPLAAHDVVLRGCTIRNTQWVVGLAVYTGHDSKLMQNATESPVKMSSLERGLNVNFITVFALLVFVCSVCAIAASVFIRETYHSQWYLHTPFGLGMGSPNVTGFLSFLTYIILFQTFIPISLYVSIEMVKVFQAYLMNVDLEMYDDESDTPAQARTSSLSDELGEIQYIFSDKTGTLTCNVMEFKRCSINGKKYGIGLTEAEIGAMSRNKETRGEEESNHNNDDGKGSGGGSGGSGGGSGRRGKDVPMRLLSASGHSNTSSATVATSSNSSSNSNSNKKKPPGSAAANAAANEGFDTLDFDDESLMGDLKKNSSDEQSKQIHQFLTLLAVCHTVVPELDEQKKDWIVYNAASPDEGALVKAARHFEFVFKGKDPDGVTISALGEDQVWKILNVIEFNSTRKRMSVIAKSPKGKLMLMTKGADTVMYERCASGQKQLMDVTSKHMSEFGSAGLRTLVLGQRELDEKEYKEWDEKFKKASLATDEREEKLAEVGELIEKDLTLLGATAIEDKLQKGVPNCIATLRKAGIKIWVLTGDKQETAINIGFACNLLDSTMDQVVVNGEDESSVGEILNRELERVKSEKKGSHTNSHSNNNNNNNGGKEYSMIIDGKSLGFGLKSFRDQLLQIGDECKTVICCRVSPLQKAEVVALVKNGRSAVTLAIGDGANDVSMIKEAHIGVGISGKEGMQAVMNSDYAIAQFRFLQSLLLVHGRWSYLRIRELVLFSFYKNLLFVMTAFWYSFYHGFSGQTLHDSAYIALYNVTMTSLPIMFLGVFDQDVSRNTMEQHPYLYTYRQKTLRFDQLTFNKAIMMGVWHSLIAFFVPKLVFCCGVTADFNGRTGLDSVEPLGTTVYSIVVILANLIVALQTSYWTFWNFFTVIGSIVFWYLFICFYNVIWSLYPLSGFIPVYYVFFALANTFNYWASIFLALTICLAPIVTYRLFLTENWNINFCGCYRYTHEVDLLQVIRERAWCMSTQKIWPSPMPEKDNTPRVNDITAGHPRVSKNNSFVTDASNNVYSNS